jgi:hypothetical protein
MLIINKKTKQSQIFEKSVQKDLSQRAEPRARIIKSKHLHSYNDWYDIYEKEVEFIIDAYLDGIRNFKSSDNKLVCSLNIWEFRDKISHLIYKKSISKEKHTVTYL